MKPSRLILIVVASLLCMLSQSTVLRAASTWYVATSGNDASDCASQTSPCRSISAAIGKAGASDSILVASGVYTGSGPEVILLNKSLNVSGGWNATYEVQDSMSILDGEGVRRGVTVNGGTAIVLDRFKIQNGYVNSALGGGIYNSGTLTLTYSAVTGNFATGNSGYGGGLFNAGGRVTVDRSSISQNTSTDRPGGGIVNDQFGQVFVNNSTISSNTAFGAGGIYSTNGSHVTVTSSTIAMNQSTNGPGGIMNFYPNAVLLKNSILAQNQFFDCQDQMASAGYNLIGTTRGCTYFSPAVTDIVGADPKLFALTGSPAFHHLLPGSPAIDAGDPSGCTDAAGNPLTVDQRGVARLNRCDIGAYEYNTDASYIRFTQLPVILRDYCSNFYDDFSNPLSGWPSSDSSSVTYQYLSGEYRILSKVSGFFFLARSPGCQRQNYDVAVDARWQGETGSSYGLLFGVTAGFDQYYLFDINTDFQHFRLLRRNSGGGFTTLVGATPASAIASGLATNHLKAIRNGTSITLQVNGTDLGTWNDSTVSGMTSAGLVMSPYSNTPNADARFDNFSSATLATATNLTVNQKSTSGWQQTIASDPLSITAASVYGRSR